jgi:antitoxin (DNA-binding transcriptional repressor) of toxin-antitoxin stability system
LLCEAEGEEIDITRHGKPAGVLIGFGFEDDWLDYQLENDPRFLRRIEHARNSPERAPLFQSVQVRERTNCCCHLFHGIGQLLGRNDHRLLTG